MGRNPRLASRALIGALLALAATTSPALAVSASSVVQGGSAPLIGGFSARALGDDGKVTPKTYFELKLKPGESYDGTILVTNAGKDFTRLRVDSVDGLTGQTSGTVYANRTDPRKETSQWIEPAKHALRLDAQSSRTMRFQVRVPEDARPGDHVGAVAFQRILSPKKDGEFAVRQVLRVAVAVQIRVSGPADAKLELGTISLKALGGTQIPSVNVQLKNTGELLCRPTLNVALSQGGEALGTVSRQLDTVLAGDTIDYPLPWPKPLDSGTYDVKAATSGCGAPDETTASVELAGDLRGSTSAPGPDSAAFDDNKGGLPWWALLLAVVGALGLGFVLARRTTRPKDEPAAAAPAAPAPPAAASPEPPSPAAASDAPAEGSREATPPRAVAIEPEPPRDPGR